MTLHTDIKNYALSYFNEQNQILPNICSWLCYYVNVIGDTIFIAIKMIYVNKINSDSKCQPELLPTKNTVVHGDRFEK